MSYDRVDAARLVVAGISIVGFLAFVLISGYSSPAGRVTAWNGDTVGRENDETVSEYAARCASMPVVEESSFALVTFRAGLSAESAAQVLDGVRRVSAIIPMEGAPIVVPEPVGGGAGFGGARGARASRAEVFSRWAGGAQLAGAVIYDSAAAKQVISENPQVMCVESLPADAAWGRFGIKPVL